MDNYKLGRRVLDAVDADPDQFDMGDWVIETSCGTSFCLGGHTLILSGYTYRVDGGDIYFTRPDGSPVDGGYADEAERLLGFGEAEKAERQDGGKPEIWFDPFGGLRRFRALVEDSEAKAAGVYRTKTGRILDAQELDALAAEAEQGYDVDGIARS